MPYCATAALFKTLILATANYLGHFDVYRGIMFVSFKSTMQIIGLKEQAHVHTCPLGHTNP